MNIFSHIHSALSSLSEVARDYLSTSDVSIEYVFSCDFDLFISKSNLLTADIIHKIFCLLSLVKVRETRLYRKENESYFRGFYWKKI